MREVRMRVWASALEDLTQKFKTGEAEKLWFYDEDKIEQELDFHVITMKTTPPGHRIELSGVNTLTQRKVTVVIYTSSESDIVELNFYSAG